MSLNPKLAVARRQEALDLILAHLNSGFIRIYTGSQPADADTAVGAQTLLATLTFGATAFGATSGSGVATANAITQDSSTDASGTAAWCRMVKSNGTTVVMDGTVGTSAANLIVGSTSFTVGVPASIGALTVTFPA